ncbi:MAG TPA: Wzz/FepE/Etk N-terminal domain-containing protein [Acidimicrobiia bacterium]|nr:Wzz/FepE/Etk N-terminal domain-containing protein [Acidimicrobiia bacterium]
MSVSDYVQIVRQFIWLIVITAVVGGGIAFAALQVSTVQYQAKFAVTLAPRMKATGAYGSLIDALDRRSVPSTFAEIVMSPLVKDTVASAVGKPGGGVSIDAVVLSGSNVIEATIIGDGADPTRASAAGALEASTRSFTRLYPPYSVTPLRTPAGATVMPRHLVSGTLLGGAGGAVLAALLGLAIDAGRHPRGRDRIAPAPATAAPAPVPVAAPPPARARPPWKPRPRRSARSS